MNFSEIRALFDLGSGSYGVPEAELAAAEARLGLVLPAVLRQYYLQLGACEPLNHTQDELIPPAHLALSAQGTHLVFYAENQAVYIWGIARPDLELPDPPVYRSPDDDGRRLQPTWEPEGSPVSAFLLAMAHQQALFAWPCAANAVGIDAATVAQVRAGWPVRPVALSAWGATYFQAVPDELLALFHSPSGDEQTQTDLFVAAKNPAAFAALLSRLGPVAWEYSSLEDED